MNGPTKLKSIEITDEFLQNFKEVLNKYAITPTAFIKATGMQYDYLNDILQGKERFISKRMKEKFINTFEYLDKHNCLPEYLTKRERQRQLQAQAKENPPELTLKQILDRLKAEGVKQVTLTF